MTNKPQIKINNPCPMTMGRLKNGREFACNSCNTIIVDFRGKTTNEIIQVISKKKTCGIFNDSQVIVPKFSLSSNLLFKILTILAFIGFNVKPINAQTTEIRKDSISFQKQKNTLNKKTEINESSSDTSKIKLRKKKWWRRKRKTEYRTIGCPSF
jgi:hypothetical protein